MTKGGTALEPTNSAGEYLVGASKLTPSVSAAGLTAAGVSLQDWVYIVTLIYTVLMTAHLIYKWNKERNGR
jgi:hypothetical protein